MNLSTDFDELSRPIETSERTVITSFEPFQCKEHFEHVRQMVEEQFEVAEKLQQDGKNAQCEMIWRSQYVLIVAAFDFYMHELTKYGMRQMSNELWKHTSEYEKMEIPIATAEELIRVVGNEAEYEQCFLEYITNRFGTVTLIDGEKVVAHLKLLGLYSDSIANRCYTEDKDALRHLKADLKNIFEKRNKIAHQVDQSHQDASEYKISKAEVEMCIAKLTLFINAIDCEIDEKNRKRVVDKEFLFVKYTEDIFNADSDQFHKDYRELQKSRMDSYVIPYSVVLSESERNVLEKERVILQEGKAVELVLVDMKHMRKSPFCCNLKQVHLYEQETKLSQTQKEKIPRRYQEREAVLFFEVQSLEKREVDNLNEIYASDIEQPIKEAICLRNDYIVPAYQKKY